MKNFILIIFFCPIFIFSDTNIKKYKLEGGINTYSSQPFNIPRPISNAMYNNFSKKLNKHLNQKKSAIKKKNKNSKSMADQIILNNPKEKTINEKEYRDFLNKNK